MTHRTLAAAAFIALSASLAAQQPPDRTHPPQPGPPAPLNLPAIHKARLANGLPVWVVVGDARQHRIDRKDGHGDSSRLTNGQETDPSVHDDEYSPPAPAVGTLTGQHTRA